MSLVDELKGELVAIKAAGLTRRLRTLHSPQGAEIILDGRPVINFSANDDLGFANHPALREAAAHALRLQGVGSGAARLIVGNLPAHRDLETKLAEFHGAEAALLFSSGYQANVGVLAA